MSKKLIVGVMTGNSMDSIDLVLTEFSGEKIHDICSYSVPYSVEQKRQIDNLRFMVTSKKITAGELVKDTEFLNIHDDYINGIAYAINTMFCIFGINIKNVDAVGLHGKTLDHNPPSIAVKNGIYPYTTQMGSAQMLANLLNIPVINDFRSEFVMNGYEGAPLIAPHNAHIAKLEGDGCYFNGGNTSNLAWICNNQAQISWDAGPFNEYIDSFMLKYKNINMDFDAQYGLNGKLLPELAEYLFDINKEFYEQKPPKSGDPSYYATKSIFEYIESKYGNPAINEELFCDCVHSFEYFAAYLAYFAVAQTPEKISVMPRFLLFGGGWKNPLVKKYFTELAQGSGYVMERHKSMFRQLQKRLGEKVEIKYSDFGVYMEARLFADMAYYKLQGKYWPLPELQGDKICAGTIRYPNGDKINDYLSRAAYGWKKVGRV